ncbi:DUF6250 domain-containing protein [Uliginosibacterium sp. 31-12]|uniref:DUF6250 domain-containing protein n=1 Tax=Uliginosibacterium sp. 31-12 TaxID=3062781 RepID=UPI0026E18513|nr:DUF6250 domain-containing protein [Uliginosibacterium sp. 31-12]MDO6385444.1 DUF6250 domain-containing protein [Uliginosibacterium sp. 31-12]
MASSSKSSSAASSAAVSSGLSSSSSSVSVLASDDFTQGLSLWKVEQEDATGTVTAANGVLDIVQPAGATLWFKQKFSGDYEIRFTATPIPYTVTVNGKTYTERISDLNMFWNAVVPTGSDPDPTHLTLDGKLASYNPLTLYYVGFGANSNTTTRLRRYDGTATRPQITGYATAASRTADDTAGDMTAATSLVANTPVQVRVVSRAATASDPATLKWYANDKLVFSYADATPFLSGWFGFRTTVSHWKLSGFSVVAR